MKNLMAFIIGSSCLAASVASDAQGLLSHTPLKEYRLVVSGAGGYYRPTTIASNQNFPITSPIISESYQYSPSTGIASKGFFELFAGLERNVLDDYILQGGIAYDGMSANRVRGSFVQGPDSHSSNTYSYSYSASFSQLLAQLKLMRKYHQFLPYILLGLGAGFNSTQNYTTTVPPFQTFTRQYTNHHTTSFAFQIGLGVDAEMTRNIRFGVGYRFADLGQSSLGSATIDNINVAGSLSQSHVYANELVCQFTLVG